MKVYRGIIRDLLRHWSSGLAHLVMADGKVLLCDYARMMQLFLIAFGEAGQDRHLKIEAIRGREIVYSLDQFGLLTHIEPLEHWTGPTIPPEGLFLGQ